MRNYSEFFRFFLIFSTISLIVFGTTGFLFKKRLGLSARANKLINYFLGFAALVIVVGPLLYRFAETNPQSFFHQFFQFTQYFLMGWVGVNFLVFLFLEFLQMIATPFDPNKRIFLTQGLARGMVASTTLASFAGLLEAHQGPEVVNIPIQLKTLPQSFNGIRIAQISDVHIGPLLHLSFLENVVNQVMALNADLIFITGDLVDGSVEQLKSQMEPLKKLKAREGVYFCTGNHEFYSGAPEWIQYLEGIGIHVFKNSNIVLERKNLSGGTEKLLIGGVHDWHGYRFSDEYRSDAALAAKTTEIIPCKILLAHNPLCVDDAAAAGFHFQFSGHTHAGQFYPFVFLVKLRLKHNEGLYTINNQTQLYVNRGTGYWGPPNRLGKRAEITHFTIKIA